jgi:hypothetical protein
MQQVVSPLNTGPGANFVSVYLDDILVFSHNLEEHLGHLQAVIQRLVDVGLKLKPAKCKFVGVPGTHCKPGWTEDKPSYSGCST